MKRVLTHRIQTRKRMIMTRRTWTWMRTQIRGAPVAKRWKKERVPFVRKASIFIAIAASNCPTASSIAFVARCVRVRVKIGSKPNAFVLSAKIRTIVLGATVIQWDVSFVVIPITFVNSVPTPRSNVWLARPVGTHAAMNRLTRTMKTVHENAKRFRELRISVTRRNANLLMSWFTTRRLVLAIIDSSNRHQQSTALTIPHPTPRP